MSGRAHDVEPDLPTLPPVERPSPAQREAAHPEVSAWVGANAGSGKTRVLTQRVARLLLAGASPGGILCLTYTKAAASEMQSRLFDMLGRWAMAPDAWLEEQLAALEGIDGAAYSTERLARARRLFAQALETPGGLKIQTIHAFCDALLRRFPLEAGVSPQFEVIDERQVAQLLGQIRADLAAEAEADLGAPFDRIAARLSEVGLDALMDAVMGARRKFGAAPVADRLKAHFGASGTLGQAAVLAQALATLDRDRLGRLAVGLRRGGKGDQASAVSIAQALQAAKPVDAVRHLFAAFFTKIGTPRSRKGFPIKAVLEEDPVLGDIADEMIAWTADLAEAKRQAEIAERTADLEALAHACLAAYSEAKSARALLDFDDLIKRAEDLLTRSDMAAWTLWKLDRGIDHILVDEAQDTSPEQWTVIKAIAGEFHAGDGARDVQRTLFVVGDEKQSIYSFQGADPAVFGTSRAELADRLQDMGQALRRPDLVTSYRSAPGILAYVDAVFAGDAGHGLTVGGGPVIHEAHRRDDGARVDLWPVVESEPHPEDREWWRPVDQAPPGSAKQRLAGVLAREIARMIAEDRLPSRAGHPGRRVCAGDIMVLVTKRDHLANALIRELKACDVPVAGSDRLTLAAELAVKDLLALARVVVTPADDLSLAALLRSPLCGVSEEGLFKLTHGRGEARLWDRVMAAREAYPEAAALLEDMAAQADYLRPYEFLERVLIRHDGRRKLIGRLGIEAEDPIDELLSEALAYEQRRAPSLAGFVDWIDAADVRIKREMDRGLDQVRVMTVHGAKGLEAPIVILPDTMSTGAGGGNSPVLLPIDEPPLVLWAGTKPNDDQVTATARAAAEARAEAERKRLLYVALTRAEDWLILCGAEQAKQTEGRWYGLLADGMERMAGAPAQGPADLSGPILRHETQPAPGEGDQGEPISIPLTRPEAPPWLAPAPEEQRVVRRAPSALWEAQEAHGGAGLRRDESVERGNAIHLLLERLPLDAPTPREAATALLSRAMPGLDPSLAQSAIEEAMAVFGSPFASELFGPDSLAEVALSLSGDRLGVPLLGRADRVVVTPGQVLVVDYKSDARPPSTPDHVATRHLVQLAAYRMTLAALYPGREVSAAILWTAGPALMPIPHHLLESALAALDAST